MTFAQIFAAYYALYRAEAQTPSSTDDEYTIALQFANEALGRWSEYDGTYWNSLFTTAQTDSTGGVVTVTAGTTEYAAPDAMKEAGGFIKIKNSDGNTVRQYGIIQPDEAQFRSDDGQYAYFTGNAGTGFTLHLNPAPDDSIDGMDIDYVYYKKPTIYEDDDTISEIPDPYFIVHRMLAMRFRASRNPYYQTAFRDSEEALKVMQADNNSGNWANPWKVADNSGAVFGEDNGGSFFGR